MANKNIEKTFTKLEKEVVKAGMIKKIEILQKWYSPESDMEKALYNDYKKKLKKLWQKKKKLIIYFSF